MRHIKSGYVGLLGGSFDPPHAAHVMVSQYALKALALDCIYWLITPQNPLKAHAPAPIDERLRLCQKQLRTHRNIIATDIEARLNTHYTIDTIRTLKTRFMRTQFVWLMASDSFAQLHRWKTWQDFMHEITIAVYPRPPHTLKAGLSPAAQYGAQYRLPGTAHRQLKNQRAPAWIMLNGTHSSLASHKIRQAKYLN